MAKEDKNEMKSLDKALSHLLESQMFEKLILKVKTLWHTSSPQQNPNAHAMQNTLHSITQKQAIPSMPEPQVVEKIVEKRIEVPVEKIVEKKVQVPVTPTWAVQLEAQYQLWQSLQAHPHLHTIFNQTQFSDEAKDVLTFVACASQWENVVRVWDALAEQCKASHQPISNAERALLQNCIDLYNRTTSKPAQLVEPQQGDPYDYQKHTLLGTGTQVQTVLLPALATSAKPNFRLAIIICH